MSIKALREFSATPPQPKVAARLRGVEVFHPATDKGGLPGHADSGGLGAAQMLVPVDFSDRSLRALSFAGGLARQFGASIGLLHVVAPSRIPGRLLRRRRDVGQRQREALARIQEWQAVAVSRCRRAGAAVALGRPAAEIVAAAERLSADLIVLASSGRNWLTKFLPSGTAAGVVNASTRPVLVIPEKLLLEGAAGMWPSVGSLWNNMLVPVDMAEAGQPALRHAAAWAGAMKSRLTLFRVLSSGAGAGRRNPFRARHRPDTSELQAIARREVGEGIELHILPQEGAAEAEMILKAAAAARSEMVVLTLDRTGRRMASALLRANRCAVLAVPERGEGSEGG